MDAASGQLTAVRSYLRGATDLELEFGPANLVESAQPVVDHAQVGRYRAALRRDDVGTCIVWRPRRGYAYSVCSRSPAHPIATAELLEVARSLA